MPYTRVQVCNRALSKLGNYTILSLDDPSDIAVTIKSMYSVVLDAELSANRWGFAVRRAMLPALEQAPAFGYERAFQLPVDCLRVLEVGPSWPVPLSVAYRHGPNAEWEIEGNTVLTNSPPPLYLRYLRRVEDPAEYPASFVEAFACKLAIEICERIAGGGARKESLWKEYSIAIKVAQKVSAIQRAPQSLQDGAWMMSRLSSVGEWHNG